MKRRGFGVPEATAGLELFFNGKPMQLARYPKSGAAGGGWLRIGSVSKPNLIGFADEEPKRWKNTDDLWVFGYWQFDWAESYEKVVKLDAQAGTVDLGEAKLNYPAKAGRRFYFLNQLEALDEPGDWYLDRRTRKLYFWPPAPVNTGEAMVSLLPATMIQGKQATHVTLTHLCLEGGRDGAIKFQGGSSNLVQDCLIRNFGTFGVAMIDSPASGVLGCDLTGLGEGGIQLSGGDRKTLTKAGMFAEDNHIWAYSRWCRTYKPGVQVDGVGNRIAHNRIEQAPHQAILLSGNDHLIEFNDFSHLCEETGDAGAVYMGRDTTMRGNVIRFNRFQNLSPKVSTDGNYTGVMGVYLDDCWAGTAVYGNLFDMRGTAIMIGGGRDNTVQNNVLVGCDPAIHIDARGKGWAKEFFKKGGEWGFYQRIEALHATEPPYSTHYPALASIMTDDAAFPAGNKVLDNVTIGGKWLILLDGLTTNDFEDIGNTVLPRPEAMNVALKKVSAQFVPLPLGKMGLLRKLGRPIDRARP
jgi:hypothetical protein